MKLFGQKNDIFVDLVLIAMFGVGLKNEGQKLENHIPNFDKEVLKKVYLDNFGEDDYLSREKMMQTIREAYERIEKAAK